MNKQIVMNFFIKTKLCCFIFIIITFSTFPIFAQEQKYEITETSFFKGEANFGFYLYNTNGEIKITSLGVSIIEGAIFIKEITASQFSFEITLSNSSGISAIHFPFQGKMIKLFIHRPLGSDGGSPSVGKIGDTFPLSGWIIAHKIPLQNTDTVDFKLFVSEDSFKYQYHLKAVHEFISPVIQHTHDVNSIYSSDLPDGLKNLKNAILFEADRSTIKKFRLDSEKKAFDSEKKVPEELKNKENPTKNEEIINKTEEDGLPSDVWNSCKYQHNGKWILDMSTSYWCDLNVEKQIKYAAEYQKRYSIENGIEIEKQVLKNGATFEFRLVPPGRFWMGSDQPEEDRHLYFME